MSKFHIIGKQNFFRLLFTANFGIVIVLQGAVEDVKVCSVDPQGVQAGTGRGLKLRIVATVQLAIEHLQKEVNYIMTLKLNWALNTYPIPGRLGSSRERIPIMETGL